MEIKIGHYTLKSDKFCAWVEQDFEVTEGKAKGTIISRRITGYFRDFNKLLDDFIDVAIKDSDAQTVADALAILCKATKDAKRIAKEAVKNDFRIIR